VITLPAAAEELELLEIMEFKLDQELQLAELVEMVLYRQLLVTLLQAAVEVRHM
jgi:hypothetical protein